VTPYFLEGSPIHPHAVGQQRLYGEDGPGAPGRTTMWGDKGTRASASAGAGGSASASASVSVSVSASASSALHISVALNQYHQQAAAPGTAPSVNPTARQTAAVPRRDHNITSGTGWIFTYNDPYKRTSGRCMGTLGQNDTLSSNHPLRP
jgi:hypothetical protein